jgi:hypothetical protein
MATVEWRIRADEFGSCNCSYGCPCQFNSLPTHRFCEGFSATRFMRGISAMSGSTVLPPS